MIKKHLLLIAILVFYQNAFGQIGQKKLSALIENKNFDWIIDSIDTDLFLYYERNSYAEKNKFLIQKRIKHNVNNVCEFIEINKYDEPVHFFIIENRQKMKALIGWETNGTAHYKQNYVVTIYAEKIKTAYIKHELFHLFAMNKWGKPERWFNEGMAIYSDSILNGYHLHELTKYLLDNNKFISMKEISKKMRKFDSKVTYPVLGSFAKFVDEIYGRETVKLIWTKGRKQMERQNGKNLNDLEQEWLRMLKSTTYNDIDYLK